MTSIISFIYTIIALAFNILLFGTIGLFLFSLIKGKSPFEYLFNKTAEMRSKRKHNDNNKNIDIDNDDDYFDEDDDEKSSGLSLIREKIDNFITSKYCPFLIIVILGFIFSFYITIITIILYLIYLLYNKYRKMSTPAKERLRERINNNISDLLYYKEATKFCFKNRNEENVDLEEFKLNYVKGRVPIDLFKKDREADKRFEKTLKEKYRQNKSNSRTSLFNDIEDEELDYNIDLNNSSHSSNSSSQPPTYDDLESIGFGNSNDNSSQQPNQTTNESFDDDDDIDISIESLGFKDIEHTELFYTYKEKLNAINERINDLTPLGSIIDFVNKFLDKDLDKLYSPKELQQINQKCIQHKKSLKQIISNLKEELLFFNKALKENKDEFNNTELNTLKHNLNESLQHYKENINEKHLYLSKCLTEIKNKSIVNNKEDK